MSKYTDKLQFIFSDAIAGLNYVNARLKWYDASSFTTENNFTDPDTNISIYGEWWVDDGDLAMPEAEREPRIVCKKGKVTFQVSGKTVILRVFLDPDFGNAKVRIDGVKPSTISGAVDFTDTVSANADDCGSAGNEYKDIVLADNLSDTEHTVELYCNNTANGNGGYFPISGAKGINHSVVNGLDACSRPMNAWILQATNQPNNWTITFKNNSNAEMKNVVIGFPSVLTDTSGNTVVAINESSLATGGSISRNFTFNFDDTVETSGASTIGINCNYYIQDDNGSTPFTTTFTIDDTDSATTYSGTGWDNDTDNGETRHYTDVANDEATCSFSGTSVTIRVQKDYGWGRFDVRVDGTSVGIVNCHDEDGGGFYEDITFSGLTDTSHTLVLRNLDAGKYGVFSAVKYYQSTNYNSILEYLVLNTNKEQVPPYDASNVRIENSVIVCDTPLSTTEDLTIPRTNEGLTGVKTYCRVPTFCVYYSAGKLDILKQYDIVIIDPFAISRTKVAELQALGIIVLGYVSFGEEDGTLSDPFDPNSELSPYTGDGNGPGGYAGYYCKGGNKFGEVSECQHDQQRLLGIKACAKANSNYFSATGRCSKACQNDWRDAYKTQRTGGNCSAGHNKDDYWDRTAETACCNADCPDYDPINSHCSEYQQTEEGWGQDFSISTTDFPDENGIWGSYYINPLQASWKQRLKDFYLKSVLDAEISHTDESCTISIHNEVSGNVPVCRVANYPIDPDATITVKTSDGSYTYIKGEEYNFDTQLGTFLFTPSVGSPALNDGDSVKVSYTQLGLQCDGLFMDTVDSVDIYPSEAYQQAFADLINSLKTEYPNALFCSNRGFTILEKIIGSCKYVMFESFLSDYNWDTETYSKITDTDEIAYNNGIIELLQSLRETNVFDVLALNYCENGSDDDDLRNYIYEECRKNGFLCWASTILLNDPSSNTEVVTTSPNIKDNFKTNLWRLKRVKSVS